MKWAPLLLLVLLVSGCASSGKKWWSPGTWFSDSEAKASDRAIVSVAEAKTDVVKAAHREVTKTGEALDFAPASRETDLARRFNANASSLLTQAAGPLTLEESSSDRALVAALRSENQDTRRAAESKQKSLERDLAELSEEVAKAERELSKAQVDLRQAFARENELANTLRNERMIKWSLAAATVLAAAGWAYVRYVAGGLPSVLGRVLATAEGRSPQLANDLRGLLDVETNRYEQSAIRGHYLRAKNF